MENIHVRNVLKNNSKKCCIETNIPNKWMGEVIITQFIYKQYPKVLPK